MLSVLTTVEWNKIKSPKFQKQNIIQNINEWDYNKIKDFYLIKHITKLIER